jgi:hypothetical protein
MIGVLMETEQSSPSLHKRVKNGVADLNQPCYSTLMHTALGTQY